MVNKSNYLRSVKFINLNKFLVVLFFSFALTSYAQKKQTAAVGFDLTDFNKKFETARWLCDYDNIAWWTSDSVMVQNKQEIARLGNEWFCFQDTGKVWHAVYGKYDSMNFKLVFHFVVYKSGKIARIYDRPDSSFLNLHSRALITANKQIASLRDSIDIRVNQYIRQNPDKTFTVWIFPAFQPDMTAVFGGEFIYTIDATGNHVLKDDSYFQGQFHGYKAGNPNEIRIDYTNTEKPTLGSVFFVWYYKTYFKGIFIDNSKSISTIVKNPYNSYDWIHVERSQKTLEDTH